LPENPRALFNYLWATAPAKTTSRNWGIAAKYYHAQHERAFASRVGHGCGLSVRFSSCVVPVRLRPRARRPAIRA
jgi:hypothetical protein